MSRVSVRILDSVFLNILFWTFGISVNRKDAGFAELDVTVTSPLGKHLPIEVRSTSDGYGEIIEFIPTVPGKYKIAITYGGEEIPGRNFLEDCRTLLKSFKSF